MCPNDVKKKQVKINRVEDSFDSDAVTLVMVALVISKLLDCSSLGLILLL